VISTAGSEPGRAASLIRRETVVAALMSSPEHRTSATPHQDPPGAWRPARRLARKALAPVERFLAIEASSGILLLLVAFVALAWANSRWRDAYEALWHTRAGIRLGSIAFERDLHFWINDGVMTIFFFVVGLEIRREIHRGELSDLRRAALPLTAALGGMLVPAALFMALNVGRSSVHGWGIPMATDIAFAVGVLALLGPRVPPALRILLLALAVIDDVGAIVVIAIFYSASLSALGFVVMGVGLLGIYALRLLGVRSPWAYVAPGVVLWAGAYGAGIHPTLAGVITGLVTPVRAWFGREGFVERAEASVAAIREPEHTDEHAMLAHLDHLREARREAVSPVEGLQHALHGWVAFGAMPLFALANAGVALGDASLDGDSLFVFLGVGIGLVVGKPLGVLLFSWLAMRLGLAELPRGVSLGQLVVVGVVAGIGFTMSIFIAGLAYPRGVELETAKLGVLLGSGVAAILAFAVGRVLLPACLPTGAAATAEAAESSTEA
jgi:NhaA family Na+:H+ antiporter